MIEFITDSMEPPDFQITLRPEASWLSTELRSLWQYRDLLSMLVWRDCVVKYKQTILGPLWFVVQPLLMTLVFTVIFGSIAGLPTDGLPPVLFYMCGQLGWNYFAQSSSATAVTFVTNANLFSKVYFPRLVLPLSLLASNLLAFLIQVGTFFALFIYVKYRLPSGSFGPTWYALLLPLLVLQTAAVSLGVGLVMAAFTAKYRDLTHLIPVLFQLWMYATPVIYPLAKVPAKWQWIAIINPMTIVVESFRLVLLGKGTVSLENVGWSVACTLVLLMSGLLLFGRVEKTFVDIL